MDMFGSRAKAGKAPGNLPLQKRIHIFSGCMITVKTIITKGGIVILRNKHQG
jgi:hypothetical protein